MSAQTAFGVLARAIGLYLAVTAVPGLLNLLWDIPIGVAAGPALQLVLVLAIGLALLFQGDALARRVYGGAPRDGEQYPAAQLGNGTDRPRHSERLVPQGRRGEMPAAHRPSRYAPEA